MSGSIGRESRAALTIVKFSTPITRPPQRHDVPIKRHALPPLVPLPPAPISFFIATYTRNYQFFRRWRRSRLCVLLCMTLVSRRVPTFFFFPFLFFSSFSPSFSTKRYQSWMDAAWNNFVPPFVMLRRFLKRTILERSSVSIRFIRKPSYEGFLRETLKCLLEVWLTRFGWLIILNDLSKLGLSSFLHSYRGIGVKIGFVPGGYINRWSIRSGGNKLWSVEKFEDPRTIRLDSYRNELFFRHIHQLLLLPIIPLIKTWRIIFPKFHKDANRVIWERL